MTEISIPGEELNTASSNMQKVLQLFGNTNTAALNLQDALGASDTLVSGTANDFDSRWSDGQINKIISTFTDTDNNLADQLTSGSGGSTS
jgi:hypothetical protein